MRSFVIIAPVIEEDTRSGVCSKHEEMRNAHRILF
jgi:hypothetical protein